MRRIGLAVGLALGLSLAPLASQAQQTRQTVRIGCLVHGPSSPQGGFVWAFVPAMRGYVEGDNFVIDIRSADNKPERLPALAAELVRLNVDIIITVGDGELRAAKQTTSTIPIVMVPSGDPVGAGYIASLAPPGGNITGLSWVSPDLSAKLLEMLKDAVPKLSHVAVLWNAANPVKVIDSTATDRAVRPR